MDYNKGKSEYTIKEATKDFLVEFIIVTPAYILVMFDVYLILDIFL